MTKSQTTMPFPDAPTPALLRNPVDDVPDLPKIDLTPEQEAALDKHITRACQQSNHDGYNSAAIKGARRSIQTLYRVAADVSTIKAGSKPGSLTDTQCTALLDRIADEITELAVGADINITAIKPA